MNTTTTIHIPPKETVNAIVREKTKHYGIAAMLVALILVLLISKLIPRK